LDETVGAIQLQTLARAETTKLRQGWMLKYVSAGLFIPQNTKPQTNSSAGSSR
jgi:hypothetical protein